MRNRRPEYTSQNLVYEADEICQARSDGKNHGSSGGRVEYVPVFIHHEKQVIHHNSRGPRDNRRKKPRKNYRPREPNMLTTKEYRIYCYWKSSVYGGLTKVDFKKAYDAGVTYDLYVWFITCAKSNGKLRPIEFLCNTTKDTTHLGESMADATGDDWIWPMAKCLYYIPKVTVNWLFRSGYGGEPFDTSLVYV